jgi:hypothetical protein
MSFTVVSPRCSLLCSCHCIVIGYLVSSYVGLYTLVTTLQVHFSSLRDLVKVWTRREHARPSARYTSETNDNSTMGPTEYRVHSKLPLHLNLGSHLYIR